MTIEQLNQTSTYAGAVKHTGSSLWLIRSKVDGSVLNSAMPLDWARASMADHIDFQRRLEA